MRLKVKLFNLGDYEDNIGIIKRYVRGGFVCELLHVVEFGFFPYDEVTVYPIDASLYDLVVDPKRSAKAALYLTIDGIELELTTGKCAFEGICDVQNHPE